MASHSGVTEPPPITRQYARSVGVFVVNFTFARFRPIWISIELCLLAHARNFISLLRCACLTHVARSCSDEARRRRMRDRREAALKPGVVDSRQT
jgi:hypothetical protein